MNLPQAEEKSIARQGERMILLFEGQEYKNTQFLDWGRRLETGFSDLGLGQGHIAVMCLENHPLAYSIFQGIFRTGAAAVPVMFTHTAAELRYVVEDTGAQGIVTDTSQLSKVKEAIQGVDHVKWIAVRQGADRPQENPPEYSLETLIQNSPSTTLRNIDDKDTAMMIYTSGTTGKPKGTMLSHANLIAMAQIGHKGAEYHLGPETRISLSALPLAHIFGVGAMVGDYFTPAANRQSYWIQIPWFDPERMMKLIQEYRCTYLPVVPTMLALILNHPNLDQYDLSSLQEITSAAAPLPLEIARTAMERFGCRVREMFGQTESSGIGACSRLSDPYVPGSTGRTYPDVVLKIFDENDTPLPPNVPGEIVIRGPVVMKGYYNMPEETEKTLRGGWLHTGDIGYLNEDGFLFVSDRKKDMIIRGGENIYPVEIENIIYGYAGVAEVAVIGTPDPVYGENIVAYVVPKPGVEIQSEKLINYIKTKTSSFKTPSKIYFADAIPKSTVGKILKKELREQAKKI